ncbi:MAG: cytochrome P460 family protein [Pseudomonadota bacterium]
MYRSRAIAFLLVAASAAYAVSTRAGETPPLAPNGIELPKNYKNWRVLGVSHREDNTSLRAILGNYAAMQAAQKGQTDPWPDGAIFAKVVWNDSKHPFWDTATVPGEFSHVEFMIKDATKYGSTGGWGFARWKGEGLTPYGADASFAQECFNCHGAAKSTDHVFTRPVKMP